MTPTVPHRYRSQKAADSATEPGIEDKEGAYMTINVRVTRDETLRIKVAPDIVRRLETLAVRFGLPSSTLAAYAVAQWLRDVLECVGRCYEEDVGEIVIKFKIMVCEVRILLRIEYLQESCTGVSVEIPG